MRRITRPETQPALPREFSNDHVRQTQWQAFMQRHLLDNAPRQFTVVIQILATTLHPLPEARHQGQPSCRHWLHREPFAATRVDLFIRLMSAYPLYRYLHDLPAVTLLGQIFVLLSDREDTVG